jgi:hypothetical protein
MLNIGNSKAFCAQRQDLEGVALAAVRNRSAYRGNAYADDVTAMLASPAAATPKR